MIIGLLLGLMMALLPAVEPTPVLLITSKDLAEAWQPFADWKTKTGRRVRILTTAEIGMEYEGRDLQEKMRVAVRDHIDHHATRWVILGGDSKPGGSGHVPDRDTPHVVMGRLRYDDIPTDVYFLSAKSWDADGDDVFGEWKDDKEAIDYGGGKVGIGRIPVRTVADVAAYTEKVIGYEARYPTGEFARNISYMCVVPGAEPKLATSWDELVSPAFEKGELTRHYIGNTDLSPAFWVKSINAKKTAKLHMHGHGLLPLWMLELDEKVTRKHVAKLTNTDAYLAMTTVSCFTGQFDAEKDPSITESMLRQPKAGAVLVIAPAREGVPIFHEPRRDLRLMVTEGKIDGTTETLSRYWHHGLKDDLTAGEAHAAARTDMTEHAVKTSGYHWCQCELNLLGDPTLDLRARPVRSPKLNVPQSLPMGKAAIAVTTDAPESTVCLWQPDGLYAVATADAGGSATFEVEVNSKAPINVSVSGPSLNVVEAEIRVK